MAFSSGLKRWSKRLGWFVLVMLTLVGVGTGSVWWYYHPQFERTDGVEYGRRGDRPLTMDIIRPSNPNGLAIAMLVSGGWKSSQPGEFPAWILAPVLRRGYTVFAICHVSQPDATVQEIIQDMERGVRFIRLHADEYGIDPQKIGVTGGSAGGHLSLMLATRGDPGDSQAADPIERMSSQVQAVAIFYPVTDLLNLGASTENLGDGWLPKSFVKSFGPEAQADKEVWKEIGRECSPIYFIDDNLPPILIYHGDADTLVPLEQSLRFRDRAKELHHDVQVVVHAGGAHGWPSMAWDIRQFANWFDRHLRN
ncbi:MAG: alpha/beta hydrolase [Pirellulaceae bacterium]|nr:alpha/beta hydrolase [Pirellulaceae bacterium]